MYYRENGDELCLTSADYKKLTIAEILRMVLIAAN